MLVAEDQQQDVEILKLAFSRARISLPLHFVNDGEELIAYLKGEGRFANRQQHPLPKLLLLDLKMPRRNGFEVLEWLRLQPGLRRLTVVIFTASDLFEDINRAFDLGANSYLVKPVEFQKLEEVGRYLEGYWFKLNRCPDCETGRISGRSQMRVLLRDPDTRRFFQYPRQWIDDPNLATDFERTERAVQSALGMRLQRFELVAELGPNAERQ
jgi:CheY-like chemotaxis protein